MYRFCELRRDYDTGIVYIFNGTVWVPYRGKTVVRYTNEDQIKRSIEILKQYVKEESKS